MAAETTNARYWCDPADLSALHRSAHLALLKVSGKESEEHIIHSIKVLCSGIKHSTNPQQPAVPAVPAEPVVATFWNKSKSLMLTADS